MTPATLGIYICLGVAGFLIIVALIYTKIIKPNTFSYSSNSFFVKWKFKNILKELKNKKVISECYLDLSYNLGQMDIGNLNYFAVGNKMFLISSPLYWNVKKVFLEKNKIMCATKKKNFTLPLDVDMFLNFSKKFIKFYKIKKDVQIIIPCLNKDFENTTINDIDFVNMKYFDAFFKKFELQQDDEETKLYLVSLKEKYLKIKDDAIVRKPKRALFKSKSFIKI